MIPEEIPGGTERILLVEDEEMLLDLLTAILESRGYTVFRAKDGVEAIEVWQSNPGAIDLIISDMGLPRLGGWEMFQKIKEMNSGVRAILASGYLDPDLRQEMIQAGAKDFIQKPYEPDTILKRIREVIDGPQSS